ncbi:MAG TPA: cytochrome c3 family protein, partial [Pirellulaceae bacterium]|nr:cytochrome c3 family protein [Pirellulaceae bacterium]
TVLGAGKSFFDFRPGLSLSHYRQDYELDTPNEKMKVVGHVEQMHQSACYRGAKTFSCLTCHNPHGEPKGKDSAAHYLRVCTSCHEPAECRVSPAVRAKESPANDCIACHMPRTATDIPHLAFTHHRVGLHVVKKSEEHPATPRQFAGTLHPMFDLSHLSPSEQKRSLGLAYFELLAGEAHDDVRRHYNREALQLLTQSREGRNVDGVADAMIARLRRQADLPDVQRFVQAALGDSQLTGQDLCNALFLAAESQMQQKRFHDALATLDRMNRLRRNSTQWLLKAECQQALGDERAREQALLAAVHINPRLWKTHAQLAEIYRRRGDAAQARFHELRGVP